MNSVVKVIRLLERHYALRKSHLGSLSNKSAFKVLVSTILSQRTRDESTSVAAENLFAEFGSIEELASAPVSRIEELIRSVGFYKTKAKRIKEVAAIIQREYGGVVPSDLNSLLSLPGVGRKTANCVLVYAFGIPAIPVDTHVHRISNRLGWVETNSPEETEKELEKIIPRRLWVLVNELLVLHGQNTCHPIKPLCKECPITDFCNFFKR